MQRKATNTGKPAAIKAPIQSTRETAPKTAPLPAVKSEAPAPAPAAVKRNGPAARAKAPAPIVAIPVAKAAPTTEQIARRAYELYLARGGTHGHHVEDWAQAEHELRQELHQNN